MPKKALLVRLNENVINEVKRIARQKYGKEKCFSRAVEEAIILWLHLHGKAQDYKVYIS